MNLLGALEPLSVKTIDYIKGLGRFFLLKLAVSQSLIGLSLEWQVANWAPQEPKQLSEGQTPSSSLFLQLQY